MEEAKAMAEEKIEDGLVQLLDAALLHPERAEGYIRQVIETLERGDGLSLPVTKDQVDAPNTRQRAERAVAKIVALLIDHEADHPLGGYPRQSMAAIIAAEFEK